MPNGAKETIEIVVTPHSPAGSVISSRSSVASATPDPNENNNDTVTTTTISKQEPATSLSVTDAAPVTEGASGSRVSALFEVSLSSESPVAVTVAYSTADQTAATTDNDYQRTNGVLRFEPGETSKIVNVPVIGDDKNEPDEEFIVNLSAPSNAIVDRGRASGFILDDDAPVASISDAAVKEGYTGTSDADFKITLSQPTRSPVTLDFVTEDGTATAADGDYKPVRGSLRFEPGQTTKWLAVPVNGDTKPEPDETFYLTITKATNARVGGRGNGLIINDDDRNDEPFTWQSPRAEGRNPGRVFVTGHDADGHAALGLNDRASAQRIVQKAVAFVVHGKERTRLLYVTSDELGDQSGYKGMVDSGFSHCRAPASTPAGCFEVASTASVIPSLGRVLAPSEILSLETVDFQNFDAVVVGSRGAGLSQLDLNTLNTRRGELVEYVRQGGGLVAFAESVAEDLHPSLILSAHGPRFVGQFNFLPCLKVPCVLPSETANQAEVGFRVTSAGKALGLADEDVNNNYTHNVFPDPAGYQIIDKDVSSRPVSLATEGICGEKRLGGPGIAIDDVSQPETDTGQTLFTFTATLECASDQPITVGYATQGRTAAPGDDYQTVGGSLKFEPGQTTKTIQVPVIGDRLVEPDENFVVELGIPLGAFVIDGLGEGTIVNDDDGLSVDGDSVKQDTDGPPRREVFTGPIPRPDQPIAGQDQAGGLTRQHNAGLQPPNVSQPATQAQLQAQLQSQAQSQVHQQTQVQQHMQSQIQGVSMREKQREIQVQVAREEAGPDRAVRSREPGGQRAHLATARQPASPAIPLVSGVVTLMLSLLGLARSMGRRNSGPAVLYAKGGRIPIAKPPPGHRKR